MSNRLDHATSEARAAASSLADHGQKAIADIAALAEKASETRPRTPSARFATAWTP